MRDKFGLEWLYDGEWEPTPFWLRWFGYEKYRRHYPQNNVAGTIGGWTYSDRIPVYGGIDRSPSSYWRTRGRS